MSDAQKCPEIIVFGVESGVSAFTGQPFVKMLLTFADGSEKAVGQLAPEEARAHALRILMAAEASVHDAAVAAWLRDRFDLDGQTAIQAVVDLRNYRKDGDVIVGGAS